MIGIPKAARALRVDANDPASLQTALTEFDVRLRRLEDLARSSSNTSTLGSRSSLRILNRRMLTGSGIYEPSPGTLSVTIKMVGGGAGGGGGVPGLGAAAAGGGSSGTAMEVWLSNVDGSPITGGRFSCGEGGAGGTSGGAGSNGSPTTIKISGVTWTATGGAGGGGSSGPPDDGFVLGGGTIDGSTSTSDVPNNLSATIISSNSFGGIGQLIDSSIWFSGFGGATAFGTGGYGVGGTSPGRPGTGYGSGGSGAAAQASPQIGGAGAPGCIMIEELG